MRTHLILAVASHAVAVSSALSPVTLTTTATLPETTPGDLHSFLGSPANWPKIVASSHSVVSPAGKSLEEPLKKGEDVDEIFGLPPVVPLSVSWRLQVTTRPTDRRAGCLEFYSEEGLKGVASGCRMRFEIDAAADGSVSSGGRGGSTVKLTMSYDPRSPLATLAIPVLSADNALALKVLLPSVLSSSRAPSPLDEFRSLMGNLYGVAGLAHLADCLVGGSRLLVAADSAPFELLPPLGKAYALLWCGVGPLSFAASRVVGGRLADVGLILYGLVEVLGAFLIRFAESGASSAEIDPFPNAILVQGIVAAAWLYSAQKKESESS